MGFPRATPIRGRRSQAFFLLLAPLAELLLLDKSLLWDSPLKVFLSRNNKRKLARTSVIRKTILKEVKYKEVKHPET